VGIKYDDDDDDDDNDSQTMECWQINSLIGAVATPEWKPKSNSTQHQNYTNLNANIVTTFSSSTFVKGPIIQLTYFLLISNRCIRC